MGFRVWGLGLGVSQIERIFRNRRVEGVLKVPIKDAMG